MISRTTAAIIAVIAFVVGIGVGALALTVVMGGSGEASKPITAPTLPPVSTVAATTQSTKAATTEATQKATTEPTKKPTVQAQAATVEATMAATAEATMEAAAATEVPAVASTGGVTYNIDNTKSTVTFTLQEDLRGTRTDVVGTTNEVAGQIRVDTAKPENSQLGQIVINARTLKTPEDMRNNMIRGKILRSAEDPYEFITFTPTSITGLPTSAVTKGPITFQVTGDLKIIEVTKPVTFDVTIDSISDAQLSGSGKTTIKWADFNLTIPSVPMVANVTPDVTFEIAFVATAAK